MRPLVLGLTLSLLAGCAGGSAPFQNRFASSSNLKTALSRVEFENEKLRREIADIRAENVRLGDRLAQEQAANSDLTAQLSRSREGNPSASDFDAFDSAPLRAETSPRAIPARNPGTTNRKPPFARIPSAREPVPYLDARPEPESDSWDWRGGGEQPRTLDPESRRLNDDHRWLPVARGPRPIKTLR
jgi:hypothetical protein